MTREGYLTQSGTLLVDENIKTVQVDLEKDPTGAEVTFMVQPQNANVKVNGVVKTAVDGKCTFLFVLLGDTEYEVSAPGYETKRGTMFVEEGMDVVSVTLDKKKTADVTFTVTPKKAKISFNGETVTLEDGQHTFKDVPVGSHSYTVSCDGYTSKSGSVTVTAEDVNAVRVTLDKKETGGSSSNSGNSSKTPGINLGPSVVTPTATPSQNPGTADFTDLDTVPWAQEAIAALAKDGVVAGYGDGEFRPQALVTREEFVKMLVKSFNIKAGSAALNFSDVPAQSWAYESIGAAVSDGIVKGVSESEFGMGQPVSRQDAAVMLARALEYLNKNLAASGSVQFTDENEIAGYAKQAVTLLASSGVISGREDGTFAPNAGATRAEIAKLLYELKTRL